MKLNVPYYSQFVDIEDPFWMLRACGAASLKMVAEFQGANVPDLVTLCNEAKERGGYDLRNGWIHDYLVKKAEELGLTAYRTEQEILKLDEIITSLKNGNPVIVSVEKRILEQTRFHVLVIVGYEEDEVSPFDESVFKQKSGFYYHEPESTDKNKGAYRFCSTELFLRYWRGKAIYISH